MSPSIQAHQAPYHRYVKQLRRPLWEKTCLFEAGVGRNINGNMFALVRELCSNPAYKDYEPVFSVNKDMLPAAKERFSAYGLDRVRLVVLESDEYNECLARAKYLFNDNTFPAYFTKRPEQIYLNTWHGTPLKRLGLSDIENSLRSFANVQKNLLTANYDLFPNEYTRDVFMEDYDLTPFFSGSSVVCDYPRNDVFSDKKTYTRVRTNEQISDDQQVIAYMPTWRGSGRTADSEGQIEQVTQLLTYIDAALRDDQTFYVNLHFVVQGGIDFAAFHHVKPFPKQYETYDFLAACDVLVTDYSSVMFDYAVTGRPIVLFAYDEDEYMTDKGTYFPYRSLPFPIVSTANELVAQLGDTDPTGGYEQFKQRFCSHHDGHAAKSLLSLVIDGSNGDLAVAKHKQWHIDNALYVFSLGKKRVRETLLNQIVNRADERTVLITTASYSEGAIKAFRELAGKVHMLVIVRRQVQTSGERRTFELVSGHRSVSKLLEGGLREYFTREAGQILCGVSFKRFYALAPDGSYLMWMVKGTDSTLVAELKDASIVGKKSYRLAEICTARGYKTRG